MKSMKIYKTQQEPYEKEIEMLKLRIKALELELSIAEHNQRQGCSPYTFPYPYSHPLQLGTPHYHGQNPCWNNPCVWCY